MKFSISKILGLLMLAAFSAKAQPGDLLYDHFTGDTIYLETYLTDIDPLERRDFIISGKNASEAAQQKMARHFRERWRSEAYQNEIKAHAEKMEALYLERYEQKKATHLELIDRHFYPLSYANNILTLQENTSYRTNWRYRQMTLQRLFYFNVKTGKMQREPELLAFTDTVRLRRLMPTQYFLETQKLPDIRENQRDSSLKVEAENYFYDQYYGEEDTLYVFRLDSGIARGFRRFSFGDARLWWTGAGLMVCVDQFFFEEHPLAAYPFQVHIPYDKIKGVFKPTAFYAFAENLRLPETRLRNFSDDWPPGELYYFNEVDVLEMPDADKEELYVISGEAGDGGDTIYRMRYRHQKLWEVNGSNPYEGEESIATYRWEGGQLAAMQYQKIRLSQEPDTTVFFVRYAYDGHRNLANAWKFERGRYEFNHWMYAGQSVLNIQYSPFGNAAEATTHYFTEDTICVKKYYHSDMDCGSYYPTPSGLADYNYPQEMQGVAYLYNEKMQPLQELEHQHYVLYTYDDQGRLKQKRYYASNKLSRQVGFEYIGKEEFPSKMTTIWGDNSGRSIHRFVSP